MTSYLEHARCWFLRSGIQESSGGVARYHQSDTGANARVSAEITGYAVSALAWMGEAQAMRRAADYLTVEAWDESASTFPFEPGSPLAYFFDVGIAARGLMSAFRATGDVRYCGRAQDAALALAFDFLGDGGFHPVISLPDKQPLAYEPRWSRSPGCYQLKSAVAWIEAGGEQGARMFDTALEQALATHESFLSSETDRERLMDRLHAYCYFLEGLLWVAGREEARAALRFGISRVAGLHRAISPQFERSDVCAQLLRVRLFAHHLGAVELDEDAAQQEAARAAAYQSDSNDPRLRGGFWFGKKSGAMLPFMNPVSTAFCVQALAMWDRHRAGAWRFELAELI